MKRPRLTRRTEEAAEARLAGDPAGGAVAGSALGLDDWHGSWPVDDGLVDRDPSAEVPLLLNPNSPNIAPS